MCLYQIVCLIYLMWSPQWILMATPMKFLLPRQGGRGYELLPSSNKCYTPYHPQTLSQKDKSAQTTLWGSLGCRMLGAKPREANSTRYGQQRGAIWLGPVDNHPNKCSPRFPRVFSPEENGRRATGGLERQFSQDSACHTSTMFEFLECSPDARYVLGACDLSLIGVSSNQTSWFLQLIG